jgi:photosystem II stability/assembly factor-like uncharacterized protein
MIRNDRRRRLLQVLALSLAVIAGWPWQTARPAAQAVGTIDSKLFEGLRWRSVGPARGGRSIAVAGTDARPNEYWFGATGGGAWKTTDGGTTWNPMTDGQITSSSIGSVGICEANPDIVYIGGGESEIRGNIIMGDGIYKTVDGGKAWEHLPALRDSQVVAKLRVHPSNCDVVWAAVAGHMFGTNTERGIFKTTDGGKSWKRTLFRDERTAGIEVNYDPKNPNVLFASLWESQRFPWGMSSGGQGSGLFKSTDAGETWTEITKNPGLPSGLWGKVGVSVSGADGNRVYALVENEPNGGLYLSDDAGATWKLANGDRSIRQRAFYYSRIYADPTAKDTIYLPQVFFTKSTDAGKTLQPIRTPHPDSHDLWLSTANPGRMIEGNDGSANVTLNGGQTWTDQDAATGQFYNVFVTMHVPYHVCGAQQDNTTACISSAPAGGFLSTPSTWYEVGGGESGYIAPDPTDTEVFYAGSYGGYISRFDRRTGQRRQVDVWPDNPMGYGSESIAERFQWTFPIVFSPADKKTIYVSSQHLWRTTTQGQNWERISPDLTRHDPKTMQPSGGPITKDNTGVETYAVIFAIAPSHHDTNTIWVGSDDGLVHVTRDGGKNWTNITPPDLPEFARISLIEASPHQNGVAYLAANRHQMDDQRPYVYKTSDFGRTWTAITTGVAPTHFARQLREDPKRRGLLYLGAEHGVYVSFDDGAHWQSLQLNLPDTSVQGVQVAGNDLVIGTHGRGFYVLDDIDILREATSTLTTEVLHVFAPQDVLRGRDRNLSVDYYLGREVDTVTIEFLDQGGQVIRTLKGDAKAVVKPPTPEEELMALFFGSAPKVSTKPGLNRLSWDLRYEGATVFPGMIMWAAMPQRGPLAPPGSYSVRVTAGDAAKTQTFKIGVDPRLTGVTEADLTAQFKLSSQIRDAVSQANLAVIQIRALREQLNDRVQKVPPRRKAEVQALVDGLMKPLSAVEEEVYQVKNHTFEDPLNYPIKLNNKIAALAGVIESADSKPTDQSLVVFQELNKRLDAEMQRMKTTLTTELPRINAVLKRERLTPVDPNAKLEPKEPPKPH